MTFPMPAQSSHVARSQRQLCAGLFSAKYSWLSAFVIAACRIADRERLRTGLAVDDVIGAGDDVKWLISWISVPALESVPGAGAVQ